MGLLLSQIPSDHDISSLDDLIILYRIVAHTYDALMTPF
jgi:hypothetical protein